MNKKEWFDFFISKIDIENIVIFDDVFFNDLVLNLYYIHKNSPNFPIPDQFSISYDGNIYFFWDSIRNNGEYSSYVEFYSDGECVLVNRYGKEHPSKFTLLSHKEFFDNIVISIFFHYICVMILPALYKLTNGNKIQVWTVEVEDNRHRVISGQIDGKKVTSEWTVCQGKNVGRSNQTTPYQQAIKEAQSMWEKKVSSGYFERVVEAETGEKKFFSPMLAKEFTPQTFSNRTKVFVQPKLDGLRCVISKSGMFSRNGKEFVSAPHILEQLSPLFDKNPDLVLDGELYNHIYHDNFNQIVSLVKKTKPTPEDINESKKYVQYWCYDVLSLGDMTYSQRNQYLKDNVFNVEYPSCFLLRTDVVKSLEEVNSMYGEYVEEGFEGQMVRLDMPYEIGKRSKHLLKHKSFQDAEFQILDIVEGVGNKSGMAGYMIVKNNDESTFKSNIKGDRDYCKKLLENKERFVGKLATIKYFNLTPDGVPRFPYVIKIDRDEYE